MFLSVDEVKKRVRSGCFDARLKLFYGADGDALIPYRERIAAAADSFAAKYGDLPVQVFSVSGRTELGGNHTDHQHGCVLAAAVSADILAVAAKTDDTLMRVQSEGYPETVIRADDHAVHPEERGTSAAFLRGIAARLAETGAPPGGFCVYAVSDVPQGSGMSSSAAYAVMLGTVCSHFYADGAVTPVETALAAQYAENVYFGKPCGLMDQLACAAGGVTAMDFADPAQPVLRHVPLDLAKEGYALCLIDTGADHADLTAEYAAVPAEMCAAAKLLGGQVLRDVPEAYFMEHIADVRAACGDRAVLRTMHYYADTKRAVQQADALEQRRFSDYLALVQESGASSVLALQNIYPSGNTGQQAAALAIALCGKLLAGKGAYRIHGGGFAGTVQAYVPLEMTDFFRRGIEQVFGDGSCKYLRIRQTGASALWDDAAGITEKET